MTPEQVASCIERTGVGFLFAQSFHPAMKFAAPLRREIGVPTVFNILGPLTNPASANSHVLGTPSLATAELLAGALARLGVRHALVVSSDEGLDEISVSAPTTLFEVRGTEVTQRRVTPKDLGVTERTLDEVRGGSAKENAEALRAVLRGDGSAGAARLHRRQQRRGALRLRPRLLDPAGRRAGAEGDRRGRGGRTPRRFRRGHPAQLTR